MEQKEVLRIIRPLEIEDYHKNFIELLSQLTVAPSISFEKFKDIFSSLNNNHLIFIIEEDLQIIASGSILFDHKFTWNGGIVAHIEDIVVHRNYRNQHLGLKIVQFLIDLAKEKKYYKIILDCKSSLVDYYKKLGFEEALNHMILNLREK